MLYTYRCPECNKTFEEMKPIDKRYYAYCPRCETKSPKIISATCEKVIWQPRWIDNIAPRPVFIESRKQLANVCNMMGNYSNFPFTKNKREFREPYKQEKREVLRRLKHGDY